MYTFINIQTLHAVTMELCIRARYEYITTNLQHALFTKITLHTRLHCVEIFQCGDGQIDSSHKLVEKHINPNRLFPKRKCGTKDQCFRHHWFEKWSWLHYNELNDTAY